MLDARSSPYSSSPSLSSPSRRRLQRGPHRPRVVAVVRAARRTCGSPRAPTPASRSPGTPRTAARSTWWYCVVRNGEGCLRVDPPRTTLSLTKLWPGRTTTYTVVTVSTNGQRSAPSNSVTHTTPPDITPPSPAPVVSLQNAWPTRITVSWTLARRRADPDLARPLRRRRPRVRGVPLVLDDLLPRAGVDAHVPGQGARLLREHRREQRADGDDAAEDGQHRADGADQPAVHLPDGPARALADLEPVEDDTDPQGLILYETYLNGVLVPDGLVGGTEHDRLLP